MSRCGSPGRGEGIEGARCGQSPVAGAPPACLNSVTERVLTMLDDEIIAARDLPLRLYRSTIDLLAAARDLGPCDAGDPRLRPEHRCDLCGHQATDGRLLSSPWHHEREVRDGRLRIFATRHPGGEEELYWVC